MVFKYFFVVRFGKDKFKINLVQYIDFFQNKEYYFKKKLSKKTLKKVA